MKKYSKVIPCECEEMECLENEYNLFALFDTPSNVLFINTFIDNINKYKDVFKRYFTQENIFFSCKSNKSYALLYYASKCNCGIEVSSYYELIDALKFTNKIIASGPAKDKEYILNAINNNVIISVDDIEELKEICKFKKKARILLRISNLLKKVSRFGINISQIDSCLKLIDDNNLILEGFSFHINNYSLTDRISAVKELINIIDDKKIKINFIDIGGGLPTNYCTKEDFENFKKENNKNMYFNNHFIDNYYPYYTDIADEKALDYILKNIYELLNNHSIKLIIEPGRCLLKNVGVTIFSVRYIKKLSNDENLIVTNGNINCLSEQWFNSDYLIEPKLICKSKQNSQEYYASICGNLCLEQDMITWRKIKFDCIPKKDDILIYYNTAGYQMDSNESGFHKIPLANKKIAIKDNNKYIFKEDKEYDRK